VPDEADPRHRGLDWTGERALPWIDDLQVVYEHYHRYVLCRPWVSGKDVLDLGCGEGYGADLLARTARSVRGLDLSHETVAHATARYGRPGLSFTQGSMTDAASVQPDSCDVVVCFEALEHVVEHDELVAVVRKALRPGGLFVTSTPERVAYNHERTGGGNPHHVRELTRPELADLLRASFAHIALLDQQVAVGSLVTTESPAAVGVTAGALRRQVDGWDATEVPPATYLLALASDDPLPALPKVSVLIDPELELVRNAQREMHDSRAEVAALGDRLAEARQLADRRRADAAANADVLRTEGAALRQELLATRQQLRDALELAADLRTRVDHLEGSRAYRGYRALRAGYAAARSTLTSG
jgi:2-polyprenyl-3-methyl-5-hydroxy-6-metoxy-1,4-benzoquinol methylase